MEPDEKCTLQNYFDINKFGYFTSEEKANNAIMAFEQVNGEKYVSVKTRCLIKPNEGFKDIKMNEGYKVWWNLKAPVSGVIDFDGVPYTINKVIKKECQHGPDRMRKHDKQNENKAPKNQKTTTVGCPAAIHIKHVTKFPQFKIKGCKTKGKCEYMSKRLRDCFNFMKSSIKTEERWYVEFPSQESHQFHRLGQNPFSMAQLDMNVCRKLQELHQLHPNAQLKDIHQELLNYVINDLFKNQKPPRKSNRAFFPIQRDVKNYIFLMDINFQSFFFEGLPKVQGEVITVSIEKDPTEAEHNDTEDEDLVKDLSVEPTSTAEIITESDELCPIDYETPTSSNAESYFMSDVDDLTSDMFEDADFFHVLESSQGLSEPQEEDVLDKKNEDLYLVEYSPKNEPSSADNQLNETDQPSFIIEGERYLPLIDEDGMISAYVKESDIF